MPIDDILESGQVEEVLSVLEGTARNFALEGVMAVAIYPRRREGEVISHHTLHLREIGGYVVSDVDGSYNCYGVVLGKVAVARRTAQDSGFLPNYDLLEGESPYRGAIFVRHLLCDAVVAFSGGTQDQDVVIASRAAEHLERLLNRQIEYVAREVGSTWTPVGA